MCVCGATQVDCSDWSLSALGCGVCGVSVTLSFFHRLFIVFNGSTKVSSICISVSWSPYDRYHFVLDLRYFNHVVDVLTVCIVQHFGGDSLSVVRVVRGTLAFRSMFFSRTLRNTKSRPHLPAIAAPPYHPCPGTCAKQVYRYKVLWIKVLWQRYCG